MVLTKSQLQSVRNTLQRIGVTFQYSSEDIRKAAEEFEYFNNRLIADKVISFYVTDIATTTESTTTPQETKTMNNNSLANIPSSNPLERRIKNLSDENDLVLTPVEISIVADIANQTSDVNFDSTEEFTDIEIFGCIEEFLTNKKEQTKLYLNRRANALKVKLATQTDNLQVEVMTKVANIVKEDDSRMRDWAKSIGNSFRDATQKLEQR